MIRDEIGKVKKSVLSGVLVGIGVIVNLLAGNKYIGAMLFSFALLTIIKNGLLLYTGKIGFIRENRISDLLLMLVGNFIGVLLPVLMAMFCKNDLYGMLLAASQTKFSYGFLHLFLLGALCGALMLIAVYSKDTVITVFCIMIFILCGFEHCIADFPFLTVNLSFINVLKFVCIVLGNSVGAIATYEMLCG